MATESIFLVGLLDSGSSYDVQEKLGLAHFTAAMLIRGTVQHNFREIHNYLESAGASLGFNSGVENTWFRGRALATDLPLLMDILSSCLRNPTFPPEYTERLRGQLLASLAIRDQDTAEVASLEYDRILFDQHPYGRPVDGTKETITRITLEDIFTFHKKYYGPRNAVIVITGAMQADKMAAEVKKSLGDWENPHQPFPKSLPKIKHLHKTVCKHIQIPKKSQTDLVLGTLGPQRTSPDYMPAFIGNHILGQFGLMGRIGETVRKQANIAYHASSSLNAWSKAGSWEFVAGVNPNNLITAIDLIKQEIQKFIIEPVSELELSDSASHLIGRLPISLESNAGVANAILTMERFKLGLDYYQKYPGLLKGVSAEQILETARRYLHPEKLVIVSAGSNTNREKHEN